MKRMRKGSCSSSQLGRVDNSWNCNDGVSIEMNRDGQDCVSIVTENDIEMAKTEQALRKKK